MILKTNLKQEVYRKSVSTFIVLKEVLKELADDYREKLRNKVDDNVLPVYQEKGPFEAEFRLGGDMLIFSMHSNVFVLQPRTSDLEVGLHQGQSDEFVLRGF